MMSFLRGMEEISETHPWISFHLDTRSIPTETWVVLGECSSKIEHISGAPLRPATQRDLNRVFLAKGAHATTAIEGNTLTEDQVGRRIEGTLQLPESQEYLGKEIDNIITGYTWIENQIRKGAPMSVGPDDLKRLNAMVLGGLEFEEGVVPGEYRPYVVVVSDYRAPGAEYTDRLVARLCEWLNGPQWEERVGTHFVLPILKSIIAHLYIAWIHPFGDGNGRTARLVEFDILTRAGVPTISAHLLSNHYNKTRAAYYRALSAARRDPMNFIAYAVQGFVDGLREQINVVETQQLDVAWRDFVYQAFDRVASGPARDRQRNLVFALTNQSAPVLRSQAIRLTPELVEAYTKKTPKTITRDINELEKMGLVKRTPKGLVAQIGVMRAFLPLVNTEPNGTDEQDIGAPIEPQIDLDV